jgi:hypothetical protein
MAYSAQVTTLGTVSVVGQTVAWSIPTLPAGGSAQLTLVVELSQTGTLVNMVTSPGAVSASASVFVLATAVTHFQLDEPVGSWTGAAGEVLDSGGTNLNGRRVATATPTTTNTVSPNPTIASQYPAVVGKFCNAAQFDGKAVVEVPNNPLFNYTTTLSASAWIYPTAYPSSDLSSILSNDQNYEFHLNPAGKLYWWWGASSFTSAGTIPLNQWTHIAITFDSTAAVHRQRMYINGVLDANTNNWQGTLANNPCDFYIGGDVATGSCALIPARNFHGLIDEVKLYTYELGASEVQADMTLGRNCSGGYDHIQIEHDGQGSICTPETVTVKACLNAACTTLYPGNVTVNLSPTGWVGGNTVVLTNGIGTRALSNATAGNVTLGSTSSSPTATNPTRCFVGATETCTMNFANASCLFDAVEPAASPQTRLFTKLAGTNFNADLLALSSGGAINASYIGTVAVDLVDSSTVACPATGSALNTAANITFASGDSGRKQVVLNYAQAAPNVRIRMKAGASAAACSTDNFAIRPASVTMATTPAMASGPSAAATPVVKAGVPFTLTASTTSGYAGTVTMDTSRLTAQTTTQDTVVASGGVVGNFTPTALVVNALPAPTANVSYDEVGYLYLAKGAYRDTTFTAVDQPAGCSATGTCDCVTDATANNNVSTSLVGATGKYGCYIGSNAAALGRFVPDHFTVTPGTLVNRRNATCSPASSFTYAGEELQIKDFNLTAWNADSTPTQTKNYTGIFARLDGSAVGNFGVAAVDLADAVIPTTAKAFTNGAGAGQLGLVSSTGSWTNGVGTFSANVKLNRASAPDGPYESFRVGMEPTDLDAVGVLAGSKNLDTSAPADGVNDKVWVGSTAVRFGRLRLQNSYGSELLPLAVPAQAQYWSAANGGFVSNTADACTVLSVPTATTLTGVATPAGVPGLYFYPVLGGGKNQLADTNTLRTMNSPLIVGATSLSFTKPSVSGWLDIIMNVPDYLRYDWGNCMGQAGTSGLLDDFPCARATFGVYKSPLIYRRENY